MLITYGFTFTITILDWLYLKFFVLFQYLKLKLSGHDMNEKLQKMVLNNNQYKCDSK